MRAITDPTPVSVTCRGEAFPGRLQFFGFCDLSVFHVFYIVLFSHGTPVGLCWRRTGSFVLRCRSQAAGDPTAG